MVENDQIIQFLDPIPDLNDRDKTHIANLIKENFPFNRINTRNLPSLLEELVLTSAYLYSKCPGNSDTSISYKNIKAVLSVVNSSAKLNVRINTVKELGFISNFCLVTSTVVLRNMLVDVPERVKLFTYVNQLSRFMPREEFIKVVNGAINLSDHPKVVVERQGKDPYGVAAGCFYISGIITKRGSTQRCVAKLFNVVEVTIRNRYLGICEAFNVTDVSGHRNEMDKRQRILDSELYDVVLEGFEVG